MSTHDAVRERLAAAPWLAPDGARLAPLILRHGDLRWRDRGVWLHGEGDEATGLLILLHGAVDLFHHGAGGRAVRLGRLPGGGAIGQSHRFGGGPRLVTAVCAQRSHLLRVSDAALSTIAAQDPRIWRAVATLLYGQLRQALQTVADVLTLSPEQLLKTRLHELARGASDGVVNLSQAELGELAGLERRAVSVMLRRLEQSGVVACGYRRIQVLQPSRLVEPSRAGPAGAA